MAPEFGHIAISGPRFHLDSWGAGPFVITVAGRSFRFEDSDRFGPQLLKKGGEPRENPIPAASSPFWRAHWLWKQQGRQVEADGITCIWREPKSTIQRRIGESNVIIQQGEPDRNGGVRQVVIKPFDAVGGDDVG